MKKLAAFALLLIVGGSAVADTVGKTSVRTQTKTDVQTQVTGADGATLGQVSANNTAQSTGGLWALPAIVQSALPTYSSNGNLVGLTVDGSGRLYVTLDSTVTANQNLKQVNGATISLGSTTGANSLPVVIASDQGAVSTTSNLTKVNGSFVQLAHLRGTGWMVLEDASAVASSEEEAGGGGPGVPAISRRQARLADT